MYQAQSTSGLTRLVAASFSDLLLVLLLFMHAIVVCRHSVNADASTVSFVDAGSQLCVAAAADAAKGSSIVLQCHRCVRGGQHGIHGETWAVGTRFGFSRL